jgi:hypothetical protein
MAAGESGVVSLGRVNLAAAASCPRDSWRCWAGLLGLLNRGVASAETGCPAGASIHAPETVVAHCLSPALRSTVVADGFMYPTDFDLADGRIVVATRAGVVRLVGDVRTTRQPFLDLRGRVATWGARGLVAIAVDRSATPSRLYVAYAVTPGAPGSDPTSDDPTTFRFSRFTIHGDRAEPASEEIVAGRSTAGPCSNRPITADCIPADRDHALW